MSTTVNEKYPSASTNARDAALLPPLTAFYPARSIELFIGATPVSSVLYWQYGQIKWSNPANADNEPVIQLLVDDKWAYIQADGELLLNRLGDFDPWALIGSIDDSKIVESLARYTGVEI
jgi:hypothetical protein